MPYELKQWILVALLALSQAALSVHQADFEQHAGQENCPACLIAQGLDASIACDGTQLPAVSQAEQTAQCSESEAHCYRPCLPPARAPPQYILQV